MHLVFWILAYLACGILCVGLNTFLFRLQKPKCNVSVGEDELVCCIGWPVVGFGLLIYVSVKVGVWFLQFVVDFSANLADRLREYVGKEQ